MIEYHCDKCSHKIDNENKIILNNQIGKRTLPMGTEFKYAMICHKCFCKLPITVHKLFLNFEYSIESLRERNLIIDKLSRMVK